MTRAAGLWGPVLLYMAAIFYSSAQPDPGLPPGIADKPAHSIAYAVLGVLAVRALAGGLPARITLATALGGVALTAAYGATDEIHQMFVPGRYADLRDVVANAIGGAIAAGVCWLWGIISADPGRRRGTSRHGL